MSAPVDLPITGASAMLRHCVLVAKLPATRTHGAIVALCQEALRLRPNADARVEGLGSRLVEMLDKPARVARGSAAAVRITGGIVQFTRDGVALFSDHERSLLRTFGIQLDVGLWRVERNDAADAHALKAIFYATIDQTLHAFAPAVASELAVAGALTDGGPFDAAVRAHEARLGEMIRPLLFAPAE